MVIRLIALAGLLLMGAGQIFSSPGARQSSPASEQRRQELVRKWLSGIAGAEKGQLTHVTDRGVARVFHGEFFYILRFRQYPIAQSVPEPLKRNNILVMHSDGSIEHLTDRNELENYFRERLPAVTDETEARDSAKAWLVLSQEFYQDGFFQFSIPENLISSHRKGGAIDVSGKAVVDPKGGNKGEIVALLMFSSNGKLSSIKETGEVLPGPRPICQATKLLDPDPIVRTMAEQTILVMGSAAKEYLDEQRLAASPSLKLAIDRIWQRILAEGR